MTQKLYYFDAYMSEFSADVVSCEATEKGFAVVLDKTAFFPEGGGQPADTGFINSAAVIDVQEVDGIIYHYCSEEFEAGENQYLGKGNGKGQAPMTVRVTLDGEDITNVEILEDYETPGPTDRAKEQLISQIIERDTAIVDIVSGCTMTSVGVIEAVSDALKQAK